jgi:hypothetical protein
MGDQRDHSWYREEAKQLREEAVGIDDAALRESCFRLALGCERLAEILENRPRYGAMRRL